jgi:hypothetical protein
MNDELRTGANARLQVTFNDQSQLTLGEKAHVVVDRYVFNPNKSTGEVALKATQGPSASRAGRSRSSKARR